MHQHHQRDGADSGARHRVARARGAERRRQAPQDRDAQPAIGIERMRRSETTESQRCDQEHGAKKISVIGVQRLVEPQPVDRQPRGDDRAGDQLRRRRRETAKDCKENPVAGERAHQRQEKGVDEPVGVEEVQRRRGEDPGVIIVGPECRPHGRPDCQHRQEGAGRAPQGGVAHSAQRQRRQDGELEHDRAFMGEGERQQQTEDQHGPAEALARVVTDRERRPEQRMRHPHLGREAEDQRRRTGSRRTGVSEDDAARRAVGRPGGGESDERRHEEQEPVERDAATGVCRQAHIGLGRDERK